VRERERESGRDMKRDVVRVRSRKSVCVFEEGRECVSGEKVRG